MTQLEVLFQQLALAAGSGLPLRDVLAVLRKDGSYNGTLLATIGQRLDRGGSLSDVLSSEDSAFPRETVELIRSAEEGGMLPTVLAALASDYARRAASRRAVLKAIYWPAALAFFLALLLGLARSLGAGLGEAAALRLQRATASG